jgi:hypothetical protein
MFDVDFKLFESTKEISSFFILTFRKDKIIWRDEGEGQGHIRKRAGHHMPLLLLAACTTISTSEVPTRMVCSMDGIAAISLYALPARLGLGLGQAGQAG